MYKYEYEKIVCELGGWGVFSGNVYSIEDYKTIIEERAKKRMEICWIYPN